MTSPLAPLGAHVSIAGGLPRAVERAVDLDCRCAQIFVKNNSRWVSKPLDSEEALTFREHRAASPLGAVVAHASYLINLAAQDPTILERSRTALLDELDRCDRLGLDGLVLHPGAHVGAGEEAGLELVSGSLEHVLARHEGSTPILLEITAGQGTVLGSRLEHLAAVLDRVGDRSRLGICLDTCHAFAAGYGLHESNGYDNFFREVETTVGLDSVGCIHLNDSVGALGSRRDRHASLGQGEIGIEPFRRLVRDEALGHIPMILETPRGDDAQGHRQDLERLRAP